MAGSSPNWEGKKKSKTSAYLVANPTLKVQDTSIQPPATSIGTTPPPATNTGIGTTTTQTDSSAATVLPVAPPPATSAGIGSATVPPVAPTPVANPIGQVTQGTLADLQKLYQAKLDAAKAQVLSVNENLAQQISGKLFNNATTADDSIGQKIIQRAIAEATKQFSPYAAEQSANYGLKALEVVSQDQRDALARQQTMEDRAASTQEAQDERNFKLLQEGMLNDSARNEILRKVGIDPNLWQPENNDQKVATEEFIANESGLEGWKNANALLKLSGASPIQFQDAFNSKKFAADILNNEGYKSKTTRQTSALTQFLAANGFKAKRDKKHDVYYVEAIHAEELRNRALSDPAFAKALEKYL